MSSVIRIRRSVFRGCDSGQALLETALILPFVAMIALNALNFGYFFLVALNLSAAPRSGVEYSVMGFATPGGPTLATSDNVTTLTEADMTGALSSPTGATVQVCSESNIKTGSGVNGSGANQKSNCRTCIPGCSAVGTGSPAPDPDSEAPNFVLQRVDVTYAFNPLIPVFKIGFIGLPIVWLPSSICAAGGQCTFHRMVEMRAMN